MTREELSDEEFVQMVKDRIAADLPGEPPTFTREEWERIGRVFPSVREQLADEFERLGL